MDEVTYDLSVTVEELRAAGSDVSKQLQALLKLGNCYLKEAKTTANGDDFTKADALFNAALVRSKLVNHEISGEILRKVVETYCEFLLSLPNVAVEVCANDIRHEIDCHKEFLANERRIFKERLDKIDSCFNTTDKTEDEYKIHAAKIDDVFRDIQDMYNRLVSMLAKECESRLGAPPCDYAIIALGSVARMEATPFSDLEFGILYSDPAIGDKINYFRVLTYFLHVKVINLGEIILPALGIEQLNDFQSSDPNSIWFYDSITPRGISFDGAMSWACKTPLGRMETEDKPALELIRTPEQMAELQDEEIAVKEGYHLADVMSRATLLHGDQALLDEYNEHVAEKLNATSSSTENESIRTVGFMRGIEQMVADIAEYVPNDSYFGSHTSMGALFDAKRQFYRLISLLLSDLGLVFDIRCPSPRQIVQELQTRGIISEAVSASIKVCLSIANEMRLKTYYGYNKQTELLSPVPRKENETEESADLSIFRFFDEDVLIRLLSVTNDMHDRCYKFYLTYVQQDKIDTSVFANPFVPSSKANLIGSLYLRLHNLSKALEWMELESEDSPEYTSVLHRKGVVYLEVGEYNKSVDCCIKALDAYKNQELSIFNELICFVNLATALVRLGQYDTARKYLEEGISKHNEIFGEDCETIILGNLMHALGVVDAYSRDFVSAFETFQKVEQIYKQRSFVPDMHVLFLNSSMAWVLSELDQYEQSMNCLKRAVDLSHKEFGEQSPTSPLAQTYAVAATVYERCNMNDKALSFFKRSLELFQTIFGNGPIPGYLPLLAKLENLEIALDHARKLYDGKPHFILAVMLKNLGNASLSEKSLEYFQEGKEMMDELLGPNHAHAVTSGILNSMGVVYRNVYGDLSKSFQCLQDALTMNSVVFGEDSTSDCSEAVYQNLGFTAQQMGNLSEAKDYFIEVVKIRRKLPISKDTCEEFVSALYHITSICETLGEQDDALKFLEEARDVAKAGCYNDWDVVYILLKLIKKYSTMESAESVAKSEICNREAKEMAMILPEDDSLPPWLLKRIETLKSC